MISVPYQLRSSRVAYERERRGDLRARAGDLRSGRVVDDGSGLQVSRSREE